jgi:hypothetical protein
VGFDLHSHIFHLTAADAFNVMGRAVAVEFLGQAGAKAVPELAMPESGL